MRGAFSWHSQWHRHPMTKYEGGWRLSNPDGDLEGARESRAIELALTDPAEKDLLSLQPASARRRLWRACGELMRAAGSVIRAALAALILAYVARRIDAETEGAALGVERSVLALERLLSDFLCGRVLGRARTLKLFGARPAPDGGGRLSLKLAERGHGGFYPGGVEATRYRMLLGVTASDGGGEPLWCVRRFYQLGTGAWRELRPAAARPDDLPRYRTASEALLAFFSDTPEDRFNDRRNPAELTGRRGERLASYVAGTVDGS